LDKLIEIAKRMQTVEETLQSMQLDDDEATLGKQILDALRAGKLSDACDLMEKFDQVVRAKAREAEQRAREAQQQLRESGVAVPSK
jgi:hypothetical protein